MIMKELSMENLKNCFNTAISYGSWVGVAVSVPGTNFTEVIINQPEAAATKLAYYEQTYGEDLKLKHNADIYIKGFTFGPTPVDVTEDLLGE